MAVTIRSMVPEDVEGFHRALDTVARERRFLLLLEAPPLKEIEQAVRSHIEAGVGQFVAVDGDEIVGWCDVVPWRKPGTTHTGVLGMGVVAAYRGRGVGRLLLETAIAWAFARGLQRVELEVFVSNRVAIALYERCGFVLEGRKRKARFIDGEWEDILLMSLLRD